jgi:hypothetical protein
MKSFIISTALLLAAFCNVQAQAWGDFTLYSLQNSTSAQLMNNAQQVVKTWTFAAADKTGYSSHLLPGGSIIRAVQRTGNSFTGGPICGKIQKHDWAGNLTWDFVYSTTAYCTHHDICAMPNGNVLVIAYEARTAAEATAKGATSGITMWPDKIVEIQPTGLTTGTVVWEWKIWDHTCQNTDPAKAGYVTSISENPQLLNINYKTAKDWIHMNGVDYNPILDQITFSSHNLNEWYIIDHSTTTAEAATHTGGNAGKGGDFLYRWGNPAAYGATGTAILNVTHDAHWIPEGTPNAGRLVGFNNKGVSASASAVDQVIPPRVGYNYTRTAGSAFSPATYDARHAVAGYSSNMGASQQLPNGNMLVCVAIAGKVYEINSAGTQIWTKTFTGACPQSFKYDSCYVMNQPPAVPTITQNCATLSLPTATTYQWYMNGDLIAGEISQTYTPTQSGNYVGRITDANGCVYRYSPTFKFTAPTAIAVTVTSTPTEVGGFTGTATATVSGGTPPYTYQWDTGPLTETIIALSAGDYCVTVTDANCTTQSTCVNVQSVVSTQNQTESVIFGLSPNPNSGVLTIQTALQNYTITLSDVNGKALASEPNATKMDLTAFANGVYFVTLKTNDGAQKTQRITLQK